MSYRKFAVNSKAKAQAVVDTIDADAAFIIGQGAITSDTEAVNLRVRVRASVLALSGGTVTIELFHAPDASSDWLSTGKTDTIDVVNTDYFLLVNESDTTVVPLMPALRIVATAASGATATISNVDIFRR